MSDDKRVEQLPDDVKKRAIDEAAPAREKVMPEDTSAPPPSRTSSGDGSPDRGKNLGGPDDPTKGRSR